VDVEIATVTVCVAESAGVTVIVSVSVGVAEDVAVRPGISVAVAVNAGVIVRVGTWVSGGVSVSICVGVCGGTHDAGATLVEIYDMLSRFGPPSAVSAIIVISFLPDDRLTVTLESCQASQLPVVGK